MNKHKYMITIGRIFQHNNKLFVTLNPINACKLELYGNLWLPFIDKTQSDIVVFSITSFQMYKIL